LAVRGRGVQAHVSRESAATARRGRHSGERCNTVVESDVFGCEAERRVAMMRESVLWLMSRHESNPNME
jgi:hypothetical protein